MDKITNMIRGSGNNNKKTTTGGDTKRKIGGDTKKTTNGNGVARKSTNGNSKTTTKPLITTANEGRSQEPELVHNKPSPPLMSEEDMSDLDEQSLIPGPEDFVPPKRQRVDSDSFDRYTRSRKKLKNIQVTSKHSVLNESHYVVFVRPPVLNQINNYPINAIDIQRAIDSLTLYMNALQSTITNVPQTLKFFMKPVEHQYNILEYKNIMHAVLNSNTVNRQHFALLSDMFYKYYVKLFDSTITIAHVIVNVNYTIGKTNISKAMTAFFNLCAHYMVSIIKSLLNTENKVNVNHDYLAIIDQKHRALTNLYNFRLNDLTSVVFYKHTPDNDDSTFVIMNPEKPEILNVPIRVQRNYTHLQF
jgi:hypothetical protein